MNLSKIKDKKESIDLVYKTLFEMNPLVEKTNEEIYAIYDILFHLRSLFFKNTESDTINYTSYNIIREYILTLIIFNISYLKYWKNPLEKRKIPVALYCAYLLSEMYSNIDAHSFVQRFSKNLNENKNPVIAAIIKNSRKEKLIHFIVVIFILICSITGLFLFFNKEYNLNFKTYSSVVNPLFIYQDNDFKIASWSPSVVISQGGAFALGSQVKSNGESEILLKKGISGSSKDTLHLMWDNKGLKNKNVYVTYILSGENGKPFERDEKVWRKNFFSIAQYKYLYVNIKNNSCTNDNPEIAIRFEDIYGNKTDGKNTMKIERIETFQLIKIPVRNFDYSKNARDWTSGINEKNSEVVDINRIKQINIDCYNKGDIYISEIFLQ